jgi:hypothetical protein
MRLRRGLGGARAFLVWGLYEGEVHNFPFPGATFYLAWPFHVAHVTLSGPAGVPAAGKLDILISDEVLALLAGLSVYVQVGTFDAGVPFGMAMSNGLVLSGGS